MGNCNLETSFQKSYFMSNASTIFPGNKSNSRKTWKKPNKQTNKQRMCELSKPNGFRKYSRRRNQRSRKFNKKASEKTSQDPETAHESNQKSSHQRDKKKLKEPKTTRFLNMNKMKGRRNPPRVRNKTNQNIPLRVNIPLKRKNHGVPHPIGNRLIGSWETAQKHFRQYHKPHRLDE